MIQRGAARVVDPLHVGKPRPPEEVLEFLRVRDDLDDGEIGDGGRRIFQNIGNGPGGGEGIFLQFFPSLENRLKQRAAQFGCRKLMMNELISRRWISNVAPPSPAPEFWGTLT